MADITLIETPAEAGPTHVTESCRTDPVVAEARELLRGRTVWHVNTTAVGGGVAELLRRAMSWHADCGLRARWLVLTADPEFFAVTKQLHHLFHGSAGSGRPLEAADVALYGRTTRNAAAKAATLMAPGDIVVLHDPQTLGTAPALAAAGMRVAWRSHIGTGLGGPLVAAAWDFLAPFLDAPHRYVFHVPEYVPDRIDPRRTSIIAPGIDEASDKCRAMDAAEVGATLAAIRLSEGPTHAADQGVAAYATHRAAVVQDAPLPPDAPTVLQLARWDPLKDMAGTLAAFARHVAPETDAHLVLAGPEPADIPDDPENLAVFRRLLSDRAALPAQVRERVHLVALGLADDPAELRANALIVNALQRRATVVAQKSLQEGFGLAVAEAMLKTRPVVAGAVGGIRRQIADGETGLLVDDPADLPAFGRAVTRLLGDPGLRDRIARAGRESCARNYLTGRELRDHATLYSGLCTTDSAAVR
jgi:trehalose synthase